MPNDSSITAKISVVGLEPRSRYGSQGVEALRSATPKDSGLTANSWSFTIEDWGIGFNNTNVQDGYSVALLIQYGHATRNGGYVEGIDFINPALRPIFDQIANECWRRFKAYE